MQKLNWGILFIFIFSLATVVWADPPRLQVIEPNGEPASLTLDQWESRRRYHCQELLNYIYRDLTLKNLERSYERLTKKLMLAYITLYQNAQAGGFSENASLVYLTNSLKNLDPEFEHLIAEHRTAPTYQRILTLFGTLPSKSNFHQMVMDWKNYQQSNPEAFQNLDSQYFLDDWDTTMSGVIDQIDTLAPHNANLRQLAQRFRRPDLVQSASDLPDPQGLKRDVDTTQTEIMEWVNQVYLDATTQYRDYCDQDALSLYLGDENHCSIKFDFTRPRTDLLGHLNEIAQAVSEANMTSLEARPNVAQITDRSALLDIIRPTYETNSDATYCTRNMDIVDTIIVHHTATEPTATATEINASHLNRSSNGSEWYMIGYNYIINGAYTEAGAADQALTVTQGRPENMVGAHAGGATPDLSDATKEIMRESKVSCGGDEGERTESNAIDHLDSDGQINANFTTIGIAVVGNFSPRVYRKVGGVVVVKNETGYRTGRGRSPRYPSESVLRKLAQVMCDIQRRNPRITTFKPHRYFTNTECPGNVYAKFEDIKNYAKELGCDFSF